MTAQAGDTLISEAGAKRELRRLFRARRAALDPDDRRRAAERAARRAMTLLRGGRVRCAAVYLSHDSELDTAPLILRLQAQGCDVVVPRVAIAGGRMHFVRLGHARRRSANRYGIVEPRTRRRVRAGLIDLVFVPLLAVDRHGVRLGAGGGYYDRWFARHAAGRRPLRVGYAFDEQVCQALPRQLWDIRLHAVLTPSRLLRTRGG